jgi:cysteinyl-tRNA synthetase
MVLRLFNTLTRQKEVLEPLTPHEVRMYVCGPTVYAPPHIGNYRSFLIADVLRRYLEVSGYEVLQVMNLTDIDDKTIRDSAKQGQSLATFTETYVQLFYRELDRLNIKRANRYVRATDTVDEMVKLTRGLVEKGHAYARQGSVYFDVSSFKDYGRLSKLDLTKIKIGAAVDADEYEKDNPADFALMKQSTEDELARGIYYDTEWGRVRPGWHVECSAIAMKYLGPSFDVHMGGVDLIFPHHENEIAQSEAYTGKPFVKYWVHVAHLMVEGRKMAKSAGNFLTLEALIEQGHAPDAIRYLLLTAHYRQQLNFTFASLIAAERTVAGLRGVLRRLRAVDLETSVIENDEMVDQARTSFFTAMDDDLNLPRALAALHAFTVAVNTLLDDAVLSREDAEKAMAFVLDVDTVLGLGICVASRPLPPALTLLIEEREAARQHGDWATADRIRAELRLKGVLLEDTSKGTRWRRST